MVKCLAIGKKNNDIVIVLHLRSSNQVWNLMFPQKQEINSFICN